MTKRRRSAVVKPAKAPVSKVASPPSEEASIPGSDPLTRVADGVVEACCLVAVVAVPLYFSLLTPLGPETEKAVLLIALAAIALGAWVLGSFSRFTGATIGWRANPLIWSGLAVLAVYAVGTAFSIHPRESFFGTLTRHEGFLSHASYAVFFLCVATRLRRPDQIRRLVTTLVFASLPAALYGLLQQFGFDPAPTFGDQSTVQWPVRSSFGNHIFFGAYLVMLMPVTAGRVLEIWEEKPKAATGSRDTELATGVFFVLLVGFSYLGFLAVSRHEPALFALFPAVLAGYTLVGLAIDGLPDSVSGRLTRLAGYSLVLVIQTLALLFTSARGPLLAVFAILPVFALLVSWRLQRRRITVTVLACAGAIALFVLLFNIPGGPLDRLRTIHSLDRVADVGNYASDSSGSGRLLVWRGVANLMEQHPAIGNTWGGPARDLVGYGPESLDVAFEAVFPLKLRIETSEMNTWDRSHSIYLDILVDAGVLGLLAFAATIVFFGIRLFRAWPHPTLLSNWLAIGIASAVFGHLVEGVFGIETAASLLIFWVLLGIVANPAIAAPAEAQELPPTRWRAGVVAYLGFLVIAIAILSLLNTIKNDPIPIATIWLLGLLAGTCAVAWVVMPDALVGESKPLNAPARLRSTSRRSVWLMSALVCAFGLLFLVIPGEQQTAAVAESAGFAQLTSGQVTQGIADLQQAARTEPDEPKYQQDLANVYIGLALANPQTSEPGFVPSGDDARTLDPERVQTLGRNQLFQLAVSSLKTGESSLPLDPKIHAAIADAYLQWKRPIQALAQYREAEKLSLDNPSYLDGQALAYLAADQPQAALSEAQAAVRLDNTFWYSFYARARVYDRMHKKALAMADASLALIVANNFRPSPPADQLAQLQRMQRSG